MDSPQQIVRCLFAVVAATILMIAPAHAGSTGSALQVTVNAVHPSGYIYDYYLLTGATASFTADAGQVAKIGWVDLNGDLVTASFSGAGMLTVSLANAGGPAPAALYNSVFNYMSGHATLNIQRHDATTSLAVDSVGSINATNPAMIRSGLNYDGIADLQQVNIVNIGLSLFGRLNLANVRFSASSGVTGISANEVYFTYPVQIHDLDATNTAMPTLRLVSGSQLQVLGGDLGQSNARPIQVNAGMTLAMLAGFNSHGVTLPLQTCLASFSYTPAVAAVTAQLSVAARTVGSGSNTYSLGITSSSSWAVAADAGWAHLLPDCGTGSGGSVVQVDPNLTATERSVHLCIGGALHTLTQKAPGSTLRELRAMGGNSCGQLGDGTTTQEKIPVQVASGVLRIAAGLGHSLFVKDDGSLWVVGLNTDQQLGDGTTTNRSMPLQVGTGASDVAAGEAHSLFLKTNGTLWGMGLGIDGQLGNGSTAYQSVPVQLATGVAKVAAGGYHSLLIKTDRTLWATGNNQFGQLGDGTTTRRLSPVQVATEVAAVAGGGLHSLFLKTDGTLWAVGMNANGQLGDGTTTQRSTPVQVAAGVVAVAARYYQSYFLTSDGALWAMGNNSYGQLGDGTTTHRSLPVSIATDVAMMTAGSAHILFVKTDKTLWAAGANTEGQLGDGTTTQRLLPIRIADNVVAVAAGGGHSLFVTADLVPQSLVFGALVDREFTATPFDLVATASSGLPVTFAVTGGPAVLSGNRLTLTGAGVVTVEARQIGDATYAAAAVSRSFTVWPNLGSWELDHFSPGEQSDVNVSGPAADPDGDGLTNLLEYALGLEPKHADTSGLPEITATATDWVYTYKRPADRSDLAYAVEFTTNLAGLWSTSGVTHEFVSSSGGVETWRGRYPLAAAPNAFFRLKVER